ncbi:MAG: hypothetical protein U0514_03690 [Candidatus Andersenbacteria bacterium]
MRRLVVTYTPDDWWRTAPSFLPHGLGRAYRVWSRVCRRRRIQLYRASVGWYQAGHFTKYWRARADGTWEKVRRPLVPQLVYDKTEDIDARGNPVPWVRARRQDIARRHPMFNTPEFTNLLDNKLYQAVAFREFMPRSWLVERGTTIHNPLGRTMVIKRFFGQGGSYVTITRARRFTVAQDSLRQDFVPATRAGLLKDVRIVFIGTQPQYAFHRVAKAGSLLTNVHQGGVVEMVPLRAVRTVLRATQPILAKLAPFPKKLFALDFLVHARRRHPYLIETNTVPGTDGFSEELLERLYSNLTDHFFT